MILLADDCLVFHTAEGEGIPYSAEMISVELMGESASMFDPEFLRHAAAAVFHYFRDELGRDSVTMAEFTLALERVLRGFKLSPATPPIDNASPCVAQSDLCRLVGESNNACELFFFPRLRDELRAQLRQSPQLLCFKGIRCCVKRLVGARRWGPRCQALHDRIVEFLRSCMSHENRGTSCALVVK